MKVVLFGVVEFRPMALGTKVVLLLVALETMNIMTVAAAHTVLVHLALHEGAVDIDLIEDLAVRVIKPLS